RGQLMTNEEFERLLSHVGELISVNSFFSTSICSGIARQFLGDCTVNHVDKKYVLFKIDANPEVLINVDAQDQIKKSFAYISDIAGNEDEREVLFMFGSIFRLEKIYCEDSDVSQVWNVELTLCSESNNDLKDAFASMKREFGGDSAGSIEEATLNSFANILYEMDKLDLADKFFRRLNRELPLTDTLNRARCYHNIATVAMKQHNFDESLLWLNKTLKIYESSPHPLIGVTYLAIGNVYYSKKQFNRALQSYKMALKVFWQDHGEQHYLTATCYLDMGNLHYVQKHLKEAHDLYRKALLIEQNRDSLNLPSVYNNLANVLDDLGDIQEAVNCYEKALNIRQKLLPSDHPLLASSYHNLGMAYGKCGKFKEADQCYEQEDEIMRQHPELVVDQIKYKCPRCHQRVYVSSTFGFLKGSTCFTCRKQQCSIL
ncbi:unnamed protein product, partial [Rotaria sp. Silwood2]